MRHHARALAVVAGCALVGLLAPPAVAGTAQPEPVPTMTQGLVAATEQPAQECAGGPVENGEPGDCYLEPLPDAPSWGDDNDGWSDDGETPAPEETQPAPQPAPATSSPRASASPQPAVPRWSDAREAYLLGL